MLPLTTRPARSQSKIVNVPADMNYRFVLPLLSTAFLEQTVVSTVRVTTSYRAHELGLSVIWLGVISAAIAILPLMLAVKVGRYIDRGNITKTARIGAGLLTIAIAGFVLWPSLAGLFVFTSFLGLGHLMLVISQQVLCTTDPTPGALERMVGNYMVANAAGQGLGPYIVGWVGGDASIPPTQVLFTIALVGCAFIITSAFALRSGGLQKKRKGADAPMPLRDILCLPGLAVMLFVGVTVVCAQDLIVVYLPYLGAERSLAVEVVGTLLAVRAISSVASRFLFARLIQLLGHRHLMLAAVGASALSYAMIAVPLPIAAMRIVVAIAGFALGIAITATIAALLNLATAETRGTANSLRIMGNRAGQLVIPFSVGLIAAATGVGGIFVIIGASLGTAALVMVLRGQKSPQTN
jgi:predicted MFS family arabinose efflux permease